MHHPPKNRNPAVGHGGAREFDRFGNLISTQAYKPPNDIEQQVFMRAVTRIRDRCRISEPHAVTVAALSGLGGVA